jgi:D-amino-acid dehydrogenase
VNLLWVMPAKGVVVHIVIIGAGILGASAAFHLARAGVRVTVIDAQKDGRATAAGAGIVCPWVSGVQDPVFYRLYAAGGDYYPELIAALAQAGQTDLGYRRSGAMLVSADTQELAWLERMARQRGVAAMGPLAMGVAAMPLAMGTVSRLSPADAQALFPPLNPDLGAVHVTGGARVDGRRLAAALLRAAESYGATIMRGDAMLAVQADQIVGADVAGARIAADRVLVTAGVWADPLLRPLGFSLSVAPQRGQIIHLRLEGVETEDWPVILPPGSHYIVPFDGGRIVVGATRETGAGLDYRVTAAGQAEVLSQALRIAPGLGGATIIETRVGFRPVGTEVRPLLGWVRGVQGLAVGNGLGAAGLTIGPFAGKLLADLMTGQGATMDLTPFDPMRQAAASMSLPDLR